MDTYDLNKTLRGYRKDKDKLCWLQKLVNLYPREAHSTCIQGWDDSEKTWLGLRDQEVVLVLPGGCLIRLPLRYGLRWGNSTLGLTRDEEFFSFLFSRFFWGISSESGYTYIINRMGSCPPLLGHCHNLPVLYFRTSEPATPLELKLLREEGHLHGQIFLFPIFKTKRG